MSIALITEVQMYIYKAMTAELIASKLTWKELREKPFEEQHGGTRTFETAKRIIEIVAEKVQEELQEESQQE